MGIVGLAAVDRGRRTGTEVVRGDCISPGI